jgi:hypothetical protein
MNEMPAPLESGAGKVELHFSGVVALDHERYVLPHGRRGLRIAAWAAAIRAMGTR